VDKVQLSTGGHVMVSREAGRVMMTLGWRGYAVTRTLTEDEAALIARALLPTPPPQAAEAPGCPECGRVGGNNDCCIREGLAAAPPAAPEGERPLVDVCEHSRRRSLCPKCRGGRP
jgi:hypothetical protein